MLLADYGKHVLLPEEKFEDFKRPEPIAAAVAGPSRRMDCTPARPASRRRCNFEYSGWLTEANHLGNVAYRVGKKLDWDAAKLQATNAPEVSHFIRREYRKGWDLAAL